MAAALIPIGFIVGTLGIFLGLAWRPAPLITGGIAGLAFVSSPGLAIAAIVSGHMSRRRYPTEGFGRAGLTPAMWSSACSCWWSARSSWPGSRSAEATSSRRHSQPWERHAGLELQLREV